MQIEPQHSKTLDNCEGTTQMHSLAIERVILAMHEQLCEPLSLEDMADIAYLSPYYFNRVFRRLIGSPPGEFYAALRLDAAKRLLLTSSLSVTEVCFELGYSSLGSFTTRFTQLVGLPPRYLRHLVANFAPHTLGAEDVVSAGPARGSLTGSISAPEDFTGLIYVGLFARPIPQGLPVSCTMLTTPGPYALADVPDGCYYVLSAAFSEAKAARTDPLLERDLLVGVSEGPVVVHHGLVRGRTDVELRSPRLTDPPLVLALPYV